MLALTLPTHYREKLQKIPIVNDFITMDTTTAGKTIDVVILIFACFAVAKSVSTILSYNSLESYHKLFTNCIQFMEYFYLFFIFLSSILNLYQRII